MPTYGYTKITEGTDKKVASVQRVKGSDTVEEQSIVLSEGFVASYTVSVTTAITLATANNHLIQFMAGATNIVILRRLQVFQLAVASAAQACVFQLLRLSSAGTGGTSYTPRAKDPADSAADSTAMANITGASKGTEGNIIWTGVSNAWAAIPPAFAYGPLLELDFRDPRSKPPRIAAGTSNGLALKNITGVTTTPTVHIFAEVDEITY